VCLDQPFGGIWLADPDSDGVVVIVSFPGFVLSTADEGVDYVVGGKGRVRGEDTDLQVAEFIGLKLAMLEGDEEGVDGLDLVVNLDEVFGKEAPDSCEVTFGHGGPQMLLQIYDFDGSGCGTLRGCG
jgi:hypothetical protein